MHHLISLGVDSSITNDPDPARRVLNELNIDHEVSTYSVYKRNVLPPIIEEQFQNSHHSTRRSLYRTSNAFEKWDYKQ